ncbi:MAG TPA: DUF4142 domain-containing protein [Bacteriovoracaceae bacterium]|nr:DUF4142 domain-containing protein [Bacteriovoracaceae bacterium]
MNLTKMLTGLTMLTIATFGFEAQAANPMSTKMTDPVIVQELINTNEGEISLAKLAITKATNPEVKSFAEAMLKEHTENNEQTRVLTKKLNIEPQNNLKTETRTISAEKDVAVLKMKKGKSFDKSYIDSQVKMHRKVLEELNQKMIPNAQNEELKAMLTKTAASVKEHLQHAQKLQTNML